MTVLIRGLVIGVIGIGFSPAHAQVEEASAKETSAAVENAARTSPGEVRKIAALAQDARRLMRAEAIADSDRDWRRSLLELVELHQEMVEHPDNRPGAALIRHKLRVRSRLKKAQEKLERQQPSESSPESIDPPSIDAQVALGQQFGGRQRGAAGIGGANPGGGQPIGGQAAQGGGDYGDLLVDLIERTIEADAWQTAGGPSAIQYFQPGHAIIVTAPRTVHDDIGDLLRQLRAASGP